jgi:glyoxylase-like metal-dependent hydrolase (beta-lactamase superfamily II)
MIQIYSFYPIDSRMYILVEGEKALIVDPCVDDTAMDFLKKNKVSDVLVILTHEHYDHISGVSWLREQFSSVCVTCSSKCAEAIPEPTRNLSYFWEVLFVGKDEKTREYVNNMNIQPYSCQANQTFEGSMDISWEGHTLRCQETPGHSPGSICILMDEKFLFSGDTLVTGFATITRLPGGSKKDYKNITIPYLQTLASEIVVYPGHGDCQKLREYDIS